MGPALRTVLNAGLFHSKKMTISTSIPKTFFTLISCPRLLDNQGDFFVFYRVREKEGSQFSLSVARKQDLSLMQKIRKLFGSKDFDAAVLDDLAEKGLKQLHLSRSSMSSEGIENAKAWCRYLKLRAGKKTHLEIEQCVNDLFQHIFSVEHTKNPSSGKSESASLYLEAVQKEASSLKPRDPARVCGIVNKRNWCYLNSFLQASCASQRFHEMLQERLLMSPTKLARLTKQLSDPNNQKKFSLISSTIEGMKRAACRMKPLLSLYQALLLPDGVTHSLLPEKNLTDFIAAFRTTKSFFYQALQNHSQEDPTELFTALCIDDLLTERTAVWKEITTRRHNEMSEASFLPFRSIFIKAIDKPRELLETAIQVTPPEGENQLFSLPSIFTGVGDTYSLEKDKKAISNQEENQAFFDGEAGSGRKKAFLLTKHADIPITRRLSLVGEPPKALPILVNRFNQYGTKRTFEMVVPFRLKIPFEDQRPPAVYLLRSAIIHLGSFLSSGHFCAISVDLNSIDPKTGEPTRFIKHDDQSIQEISAKTAMQHIQKRGNMLFYDRVS